MNRMMLTIYEIKRELEIFNTQSLGFEDVSIEQYLVLSILERDYESTTTKVADELQVSKPAVSRRMRDLARHHLVIRAPLAGIDDDYRIVLYRLSEEGQQLLADCNKHLKKALSRLSKQDIQVWENYYELLKRANQSN